MSYREYVAESKPIVTLTATQTSAVDVSIDEVSLGRIPGRPDIASFINPVHEAGLPATAQARVADDQLVVALSDAAAVITVPDKLGGGDLAAIRRRLQSTGPWICQRCHGIWNDPRRPA